MATLSPPTDNKPDTATAPDAGPNLPILLRFPPALWLGSLVLGLLLQYFWPVHITTDPWIRIAGGLGFVGAIAFIVWAATTMVRAGTNVPPNKPALTIVMSGPFRFTRNPLYLGGTTAYAGLSLLLNNLWLVLFLVPVLIIFQWGIILCEERYLQAKFGDSYRAYKARVRRWL